MVALNLEPVHRNHPGACLIYAEHTQDVVQDITGLRTIIQAGSASWPRIKPEEDDGVSPTHFSYVWTDPPTTAAMRDIIFCAVTSGHLPEMHCWAAIPETGEIIDFTTKFQKEQCEKRAHLSWTAPEPPEYIWSHMHSLPDGVLYQPTFTACKFAHHMIYR